MLIEVVYALPNQAWRRRVDIEPGATADQALQQSGLLDELGLDDMQLGVFGRKVDRDHVMQRGERLELYRPLIADPKQQRRRRAQERAGRHQAGPDY